MKKELTVLVFMCSLAGSTAPAYAETAVYFSPSLECENHIIKAIDNAKKDISIAVYSINNTNIVNAIKAAQERHVPIRILTDRTQAGGKGSKVPDLYRNGLNIKVHSKNRIEHNKFVVVDDEVAITGSYNWTNPASLKNSENCLVLWNEPETVANYKKRFEYLWDINTRSKSEEWFRKHAVQKESSQENDELE